MNIKYKEELREILSTSPMWKDLDKFEQDRIINKLLDIIETQYCLKNNIPMLFNIGGKKTMSSSDIARNLLDEASK